MKRKLLYTTLIIAILCVISILVCNRTIKKHTVSKLYTEVNTIPSNNVGLLLGTSPKLKNGIDAIGYNAQNVNAYAGLKTNIRELLARVKMFIDLGMDKQPHFLGEKIIIGNNK